MNESKISMPQGKQLPIQPNLRRWRWDSIKLEIAACVEPLLMHCDFALTDKDSTELNIDEFLSILEKGGQFRMVFFNDLHRREIEAIKCRIAKCSKIESIQELIEEFDNLLFDMKTNVLRRQESIHNWTQMQNLLFRDVMTIHRLFLRDKFSLPVMRLRVLQCVVDSLVCERVFVFNELVAQQNSIRENLAKLNADGICQIEEFQMFRLHQGLQCKIFKPT
jgi:hypothetical protein